MNEEDVIEQMQKYGPMKNSVKNALAHEQRLSEEDRKRLKAAITKTVKNPGKTRDSKIKTLEDLKRIVEDIGAAPKLAEDIMVMHAQATSVCADVIGIMDAFKVPLDTLSAINVMSYWSMLSLLDKKGVLPNSN